MCNGDHMNFPLNKVYLDPDFGHIAGTAKNEESKQ